MARMLNERERALLRRVLTGHPDLLSQVDRAEVGAAWPGGSLSVDIDVPGADRTGGFTGVLPVRAIVEQAGGEQAGEPIGELLVWVTGGTLSGLEYAWYTDEPPVELPSPDQLAIQ